MKPSKFSESVFLTLSARFIGIGCGLLSSIIIARILGPSGKGILAILTVLAGLILLFGNFGLPASNIYFIGKRKEILPQITNNSLWFGVIGGIFFSLFVYFVIIKYTTIFTNIFTKDIPLLLVWITLLTIPFAFVASLFPNILLACKKFLSYNGIAIANSILSLIGIFLDLVIFKKGITELVIVTAVIGIVMSAIYLFSTVRQVQVKIKCSFSLDLFFQMSKYGIRSYLACLFGFLIIRADMFLVNYYLGTAATGIYSVDARFADLLCVLPSTVGLLLFSKIASSNDKGEFTQKISRTTVILMLVVCSFAALLAKPLILFFYGDSFAQAIRPFFWLLPGIFFLGIGTIFMQDLAGRGLPPIVYIATAIALVVNIGMNIWLIPILKISGAAIASSVAYTLMAILTIGYFLKLTNKTVFDTFFIKRKDLKFIITKFSLSRTNSNGFTIG